MFRTIVAAGVVLTAPGLAAASPCDRDSNQFELTACAAREASQSKDELDGILDQLKHRPDFSAADRDRLEKTQRAWQVFRDRECEYRTRGGIRQTGSITPMLVRQCESALTRLRIEMLRGELECPSFNLSCKRAVKR